MLLPLSETTGGMRYAIVSTVTVDSEESNPPMLQRQDPELATILTYLETGVLPPNEKSAKALALTQSKMMCSIVLRQIAP